MIPFLFCNDISGLLLLLQAIHTEIPVFIVPEKL